MLRFLNQLPRALRQQWSLSVRTTQQVLQPEEDENLGHARITAVQEHDLSSKAKECSTLSSVSPQISKKGEPCSTNTEKAVQTQFWYKYYQRAYEQVPYSCKEALGWGTALVVGLQILHLWKSGWFGKRKSTSNNVETDRNRECLVRSLYRLAMAMPQSSGLRRHVVRSEGTSAQKPFNSTQNQQSSSGNGEIHRIKPDEDEVPSLQEAVDSWRRFSDKYVALKLTQEGVQHAKENSFAQAIKLWGRASKAGLDKAHFNLAVCYENGHGVEKDIEKAVEHYEAGARKGHSGSLFNLAMLHLTGEEAVAQDKDLAVHLLQQAASLGLPQAQRELGILYTEEEMKDMKRACELFEEAAAQEDVDAWFYLGICYEQGWGLEKNECKAADLYTKASRSGHEGALYNLATFFEDGKGGLPEDKKAALELFQQALKNGNPMAKEEICRLNSLLLNRKLGDEMDASSDKVIEHSLSQPAFTENTNRNLSIFVDVDGFSVTNTAPGSTVKSIVGMPEQEISPSVAFYIGENSDEGICLADEKKMLPTLDGNIDYEQLRLAFDSQGHFDVIDTCRRSTSMNDLIYRSPGELSLQQSSYSHQGTQVKNACAPTVGLMLCV